MVAQVSEPLGNDCIPHVEVCQSRQTAALISLNIHYPKFEICNSRHADSPPSDFLLEKSERTFSRSTIGGRCFLIYFSMPRYPHPEVHEPSTTDPGVVVSMLTDLHGNPATRRSTWSGFSLLCYLEFIPATFKINNIARAHLEPLLPCSLHGKVPI